MSVMRCEHCERSIDTDFEEMVDIGNMRRLECWVCESCADKALAQREQDGGL